LKAPSIRQIDDELLQLGITSFLEAVEAGSKAKAPDRRQLTGAFRARGEGKGDYAKQRRYFRDPGVSSSRGCSIVVEPSSEV
jgi:hypothetical protein